MRDDRSCSPGWLGNGSFNSHQEKSDWSIEGGGLRVNGVLQIKVQTYCGRTFEPSENSLESRKGGGGPVQTFPEAN